MGSRRGKGCRRRVWGADGLKKACFRVKKTHIKKKSAIEVRESKTRARQRKGAGGDIGETSLR